ncbi:MAG: CocE/NonD family hydrolase [Pseudomonadota bacterium]
MTDVIETVWIPMPDGVKLAARLWLPDGAQENPVPAILEYIPYRRRDRTRLRDESMHPRFAEAGYAALRVDQRGSGDSEGVMLDEYTDLETQDGVDVIAWIAAQPWCDGNVGMFGKSWGAYNSFQVAARRPPALKAIAPVMGTDDRWLEDIHFYGGCLAGDNFWWGTIMQLYNAFPPDPEIVGERWRAMWKERLEAMSFWPAQWLEHQTRDAMWRRGSISEAYADVDIPVYFFGGWADLFRDTPFRIAEHLRQVKLLMGPWAHLYPHEGIPAPKVDFVAEVTRFWDHHLKGIDTGLMEEPRLRFFLQDGAPPDPALTARTGRWVEETVWPSPHCFTQSWALNADGLGVPSGEGPVLEICSPQTFGSAGGDMCSFAIPGDMPADGRIDAGGALSFAGAPLEAPLDLLGQASVALKLSADKPAGIVAALLYDQAPDGAQSLITRGFANLAQRNWDPARNDPPEPVVPGEAMDIEVRLHGVGYRVPAGHRLVVQIASAYWPILWPAPEPVTLSVQTGASQLHLSARRPVEAAEPRVLPEPAPPLPRAVTVTTQGSMARSLKTDLTTGAHTSRFFVDGGVFGPAGRLRLDAIGTELGDVSDRVYSIQPDDPLSAEASMEQDATFTRADWQVRVVTKARQTATRAAFVLDATVEAWDGETLFHSVEWHHEIPRNGM